MGNWLDSHTHIIDDKFLDPQEVIQQARKHQVEQLLIVCLTFTEFQKAKQITDDKIDLALGIFPTDYHLQTAEHWERLTKLAEDPKVVAIGEIGLDYYWEQDEQKKLQQQTWFIKQLELAKQLNKPVIIHSRDAFLDTFNILQEHLPQGVMHCYSYSYEAAKRLLDLGLYISLAGPVTFKQAKTPKDVALNVPLDRLLIETDCPYLAPEPVRGKRNEPANVRYIGEYIAQLKGISNEKLQEQLQGNYQRLFKGKK